MKPWLEAGHEFVLEDCDSGHGTSQVNPVRTIYGSNRMA